MKRPDHKKYPATWDGINAYLRDLEAYCDCLEDLLTCSQVLTGDDAERFAAMIRDGLDKPSGPAPTPKLDQAKETMRVKYRHLMPDVPCPNPKCGQNYTVRCCEQCGGTFDV